MCVVGVYQKMHHVFLKHPIQWDAQGTEDSHVFVGLRDAAQVSLINNRMVPGQLTPVTTKFRFIHC